jgi:hypothetical protein
MARPRVLAVVRLMTSSYLFDHLVGRGDRGRRAERPNNGQGWVINLAGDVIGRL